METTDHLDAIARQGYTIVPDVLDGVTADAFADELDALHRALDVQPAGNDFEGHATRRVYNLLGRGASWSRFAIDDRVLPVIHGVLDDGCLVSSLSSIAIGPGEVAQPIHADDQLIPLPKPHPAIICNSMWALTDFTEANGATRLVPGSHLRDHSPDYGTAYDSIPAEMPKGSVLIWHGSLWHGGGANSTSDTRIGIAMNYCAGYIRQQENQQLGLDPATVATFPPRLQRLVGYGIYRGLIGHIDKNDPARLLAADTERGDGLVWDR